MPPPRRGRGHHHGAKGRGQQQQLSSLAGTALTGTQRNITTLWRALAKQLPTIRNATHYYAHDVRRLGRGVYQAAAALHQPRSPAQDTSSDEGPAMTAAAEDANAPPPLTFETEAHYTPASVDELGVRVRSAELQRVPGLGIALVLCIEGGFALFAVDHDGVFELAVSLQSEERGEVVAVRMLTADRAVVATEDRLLLFDVDARDFVKDVAQPLSDRPTALHVFKAHIAVCSAEYSQVTLYEALPTGFKETRSIIAERPVVASSARWLAYCGSSSKVASSTAVHTARTEPTATSVAKNIANGIAGVAGTLGIGGGNSASPTLGAVAICDVVTGRDFASFVAHDNNIQLLAFDGSGTKLASASLAGTTVKVWQVMPGPGYAGATKGGAASGSVTLLYNLARGMTAGTVTSVAFSPLGAWAALATSVGTVHCYRVPHAQRVRPGGKQLGAPDYVAPTLNAACRCRSAPMSKPVNPSVAFHSDVDLRTDRAAVYTAAASATVSGFVVSEQGAVTTLVQHLTEFSAGDDDFSDYDDETPADTADTSAAGSPTNNPAAAAPPASAAEQPSADAAGDGKRGVTADSAWRAAIELRPHAAFPKLRNMRVVDFDSDGAPDMRPTDLRVAAANTRQPRGAASAAVAAGNGAAVAHVDDEWQEA
eukprot:CAMPEP_0174831542 /NCGR_PEP_ID=MMETSP1114-20130205/3145_1 /TAXON_ID=312471 /ORGANISM="Neobodo designis, Strain CCAP 1951/1" /LENGTH=653 /DNA_ID=CAMNT_0016065367 /DNA_START=76 /DNA_END=2037 /DNA_ORIENTATION=+